MNEEIRAHLQKARDALADGQVLLNGGRYSATVGRAYYAMYHSASAMLLGNGVKIASHAGVKSKFGELFAKTRRVDRRFGNYLKEALSLREDADYVTDAAQVFTGEIAQAQLSKATEFVAMAERFLGS
jgi:uncharacterized protein (UPF0332 family)